jgi:hypothetical protein
MNDIEWVAESDWNKVKFGQKVRLEPVDISGPTIEGFVSNLFATVWFSIRGTGFAQYQKGQYRLFVKAHPAVVLPTVDGFYLTAYDEPDVFELNCGSWYLGDAQISEDRVRHDGGSRLTRLEPVPETAKKVLDALKVQYGENFIDNANESWNRVAREFGVIS